MGTTTDIHAATAATASLQGRARRLRRQAATSTPMLAEMYRRRAAELDVQAWLEAVWNPPLEAWPLVDPRAA